MQGSLFDIDAPTGAYGQPVEPAPARGWATVAEDKRLSAQCQAILDRLKQGPATNSELSTIAIKYTGRISDLRAAGVDVRVIDRDRASGRVTYAIAG
jgi:hypothetical protein